MASEEVLIEAGDARLAGKLQLPEAAAGTVVFAHGSGSSRLSPRNRAVARYLRERGLGTLLFDLLTVCEERADTASGQYRFDIPFLAKRLRSATDWLFDYLHAPPAVAYFGASTGAAAALIAAADAPERIAAVVSRGGRPDLAGKALERVRAPTLLIVGGADTQVLELNRGALERLRCGKELVVIPRATHLFEEPGALEDAARHAADWFVAHFAQCGAEA
jgi:pimeloyl-ACP methyl ester carboxylesterase